MSESTAIPQYRPAARKRERAHPLRLRALLRILIAALGLAIVASSVEVVRGAPDARAAAELDEPYPHLLRAIAAAEYRPQRDAQGRLQAPNRAHAFRTYFEGGGIRVVDRRAAGSHVLSLTAVQIGRDGALEELATGVIETHAGRVEIRRPGLVEWYENTSAGLEQGFTLAEPPTGNGPLVVELAVEGARAEQGAGSIVFETHAGRRLAYGGLRAFDANEAELPSQMAVPDGARIRIQVDDAGAVYPVTIDPLLTTVADAQIEGAAGAQLGSSVAGAGDVDGDGYADVVVGAPTYDGGEVDEGIVYVFRGSASGIPSGSPPAAFAQFESNDAGSQLGASVAGAGDVNGDGYADVIAGAPFEDIPPVFGTQDGGAWVYYGGATSMTASPRLDFQEQSEFGRSVAGAGDVNADGYADVIVGAPEQIVDQGHEGAALLFLGTGGGIAGAPTQLVQGTVGGARYGASVAGAGDLNADGYADVIVGAPLHDIPPNVGPDGVAYVYYGSASGLTPGEVLTNQLGSEFGTGVAGAGDVNGDGYADAIVGAPYFDNGEADEGAAFVYHGGGSGVGVTADAQLEADSAEASMGASVSGAGDVNGDGYADVIVGAPSMGAALESPDGGAYVFLGGGSGVIGTNPATAHADLFESPGAGFGAMGASVAGAGDVNGDGYADVIAGNPSFDAGPGSQTREGRAYVYHGGALGIASGDASSAQAKLSMTAAGGAAAFGHAVDGAGDVDRDGFDDVIVGAPYFDGGEFEEGAAFIFHGANAGIPTGLHTDAATRLEGNQAGAHFGWDVAGAGDVNGDGDADVIVGSPLYSHGGGGVGIAAVFLGSLLTGVADGDPLMAHALLESDPASPWFGWSVDGAGDVDGDGFGDVVVGALLYSNGQSDEGAVFLFRGSPAGITSSGAADASDHFESDVANARLGYDVAGAGDVDGDGLADTVSAAQTGHAVYLLRGGATGFGTVTSRAWPLPETVAGAGDVNGDGYADVAVGAPDCCDDEGPPDSLAVVFLGSAAGLGATVGLSPSFSPGYDDFGSSVAGVGDVNGDGYADVAVGDRTRGAFLFHGHASFGGGGQESSAAELTAGVVVAGAGDVDGDGLGDLLVGRPGESGGAGAAYLFLGNGGVDARQLAAYQNELFGGGSRIRPWGSSLDPDGFLIVMQAVHPDGFGFIKRETEVCEAGLAFGDPGCTTHLSPSWVGAYDLTDSVTGLFADTLYRWRSRFLYAPPSVMKPGITPPPNPAHGPWRRLSAQAFEADIRTGVDPMGDPDADGVSNALEDAGPNGGDANGDGTLDRVQAAVASLPDGEGLDYVTLETDCSALHDVDVMTEAQLPVADATYDFPLGLVEMRIPCVSATVKILFHGASAVAPPYRKYGPTTPGDPLTTAWYTLPAVFGSEQIGGQTVASVTLTLVDGSFGDDTGVDGQIVDVGGPGFLALPRPIGFTATLELDMALIEPVAATGTGVAVVNAGLGGLHLSELALPGSVLSTTATLSGPPSAPTVFATLSNGTGDFHETTFGAFIGAMAVRGQFRLCVFGPGCALSIPVPLTVNGTRGVGIGGGPISVSSQGALITVQGGGWTDGTTAVPTASGTSMRTGFVHGPLSATHGSSAALSGVVQLVTPVAVWSNTGGQSGGFGTLTVQFVPEPGALVSLGAGAVLLLAVGWRRRP